VGTGYQSEIETMALECKLKSEEGLEKAYKAWSKKMDGFKPTINKPKKKKLKNEKLSHLNDPKDTSHTGPAMDAKVKIRELESRASIFKTKPKKEKNKIWLEMLNNDQNTNKISKRENLRHLPLNRSPLLFDPGGDIC
ncbi:6285_t:CDS:1, partial [Gigaspora rosea]